MFWHVAIMCQSEQLMKFNSSLQFWCVCVCGRMQHDDDDHDDVQ